MKKILFTIQLLGIVALFPTYLVLELKHGTGERPVVNPGSEYIKKADRSTIQPIFIDADGQISDLM